MSKPLWADVVVCPLVVGLILVLSACGFSDPPGPVSPTANPLVAQYSVRAGQTGQVAVQFGTDTSYGRQTASYNISAFQTLPILVAGMKPSTTYHMRAVVSVNGNSAWTDADRTFTTGSIPIPAPAIAVTRPNPQPAPEASGVELIAYSASSGPPTLQTFATDRDGNPIWFYAPPGRVPSFFKLLSNGHMLMGISATDTLPSLIREIDLAGNTIREIDSNTLSQELQAMGWPLTLTTFHHDFAPLPNGHLVVLAQTTKQFTDLPGYPGTINVLGDVLIDLDQNWNPVWVWSAFDHLDINRHLQGLPDWTHSNAIVYDPVDGNLLLSIRHQSWIVDIDYENGAGTGNILWRLGEDGDFTITGQDPTQWFYAQHEPSIVTDTGSQLVLTVMDNGNLRVLDSQGDTCGNPPLPTCYTRATIFQVDESTMQAQLLWQDLPGFYSFWGGTVTDLPNSNIEFEMSAPFPPPTLGSRIMEVTQTNPPQLVWQMDIANGFSYRSFRSPSLYPGVTWAK